MSFEWRRMKTRHHSTNKDMDGCRPRQGDCGRSGPRCDL